MSNKSKIAAGIVIVVLVLLGVTALAYRDTIRGLLPVVTPAPEPEPPAEPVAQPGGGLNATGMPLKVPAGFSIEILAKDLPDARVLAFDDFGNIWVSQPGEGSVSLLEIGENGTVRHQGAVLRDLNRPHGLAFDPAHPLALYIAEERRIARIGTYSDGPIEKIADLPQGGNHYKRSIGFGPDERLYVSIGSTCNVCQEENELHATILSMDPEGNNIRIHARGLRNAAFFTWHPETDRMWTVEMGRDRLGDDIPPDEINIVEEGRHYGWPLCYGRNVPDIQFAGEEARRFCTEPDAQPSLIDIQAHSAPLGLAFLHDAADWPEEYRNDLIVAYHGSWNRTVPTGYKLVRFKFSADGTYEGAEDFISGWLEGSTAHGRPADVKVGPDGALYVSDDHAGLIYRITYAS